MHICFLTHEYPKPGLNPGGVGIFLKTYAPELVKAGHHVTVLGVNDQPMDEDSIEEGVRIIRIKKPSVPGLNWFIIALKLNEVLKDINGQNPLHLIEGSELAFAFLQKIEGVQYLIRLHGGHHFFSESENRKIDTWKGYQERKSFQKADAFIAVSDYVKVHTAKYLSFGKKPIKTIRYMIDQNKFRTTSSDQEAPEYSLVFAGTICEKKGVGNLIDALKIVKIKYPKVRLDIFGKEWFFSDGSSYTTLMREKLKEGLQEIVFIHPPVSHDQIPGVYKSAEICIFPSFMETQGLVAPEALAMGKVVIFTEKGPGPEIISNGINGFLCNPLDINSIADAIIEAFESRSRFEEIGKKAVETVQEMFNIQKVLNDNLKFYNQVTQNV
jgi:glycosyltransferase involved in cell wall biosynthesis